MISYIRGELVALEEDKVIVDVGGMGYGIFMSGQAMGQLPPVGSKVKIHTYLNMRSFNIVVNGFTNIVQKSGTLSKTYIQTDLSG